MNLLLTLVIGSVISTSVAFVSGPVSQAHSSLAANPPAVVADGASGVVLTFVAQDALGNPVANTAVNMTASGGNNVFSAPSGATDSNGTFVTVLRSTQTQTQTITALYGIGSASSANVTFFAGVVDPAASTLTLSPTRQIADSANGIVATLTLRDSMGHPVSGKLASFTASGSNTASPSTATTDTNGVAQGTYTTSSAQNENAIAVSSGYSWTALMSFVAGPADPNFSSLTAASGTHVADGNNKVALTVNLADKFNNPVGYAPVTLAVTGAGSLSTKPYLFTDFSGKLTSAVSSTFFGVDTITARNANVTLQATTQFSARTPACSGSINLSGVPQLTIPSNGLGLAIGQLNQDANFDIAVVSSPNVLTIFLGHGTGIFNPAVTYGVGSTPTGVIMADFNKDGNQDIAVSNYGSANVSVLLNNGNGTFLTATNFAVGAGPKYLAAADFNGDGNQDLAVVNGNGNSLSILLGNGKGSFATQVSYATGNRPVGVAVADFNKDGFADCVVACSNSNTLSLLRGTGTGTFSSAVSIPTGVTPDKVVTADYNQDGNADVAVSVPGSNAVNIHFGLGNGNFQLPATYASSGSTPFGLSNADINKDGLIDLLISNTTNNTTSSLSALVGTPTGSFQSSNLAITGSATYELVAADINIDGYLDVVATISGQNKVSIFLGQAGGNFYTQTRFASLGTYETLQYDFNGDGYQDVVATNFNTSGISVYLSDGTGGLLPYVQYAGSTTPISLVNADFNGDALMDLVVTSTLNIDFYAGRGDGTFTTVSTVPMPNGVPFGTGGGSQWGLVQADFNLDGIADIAAANGNSQTQVLFGAGDGNFINPVGYPNGPGLQQGLAVGDFNGDGIADLTASNYTANLLTIFQGTPTGTFMQSVTLSTDANPVAIAIGDLNGDGFEDIVSAQRSAANVDVFLGSGNGNFAAKVAYATAFHCKDVVLADFNGDGMTDVIASTNTNNIYLFLGNGDGTLQGSKSYTAALNSISLTTADMNNDGLVDVVTPDVAAGGLSILYNRGCLQ